MTTKNKIWFNDWFNSSYYQVLYSNRSETEAEFFIDNIIHYLEQKNLIKQPYSNSQVLDLACGQGRHSKYLAEKEFNVTGIDLSPLKISKAKLLERDNLHFYEQDMREPFRENHFDIICNLFTSLGYFENEEDELKTFANISFALKAQGCLIIDFFNSQFVKKKLIAKEEIRKAGITFIIKKQITNGYVIKDIEIKGSENKFQEKVRLYSLEDFQNYLSIFDLKIIKLFGSYDLADFNVEESERLIIIASK